MNEGIVSARQLTSAPAIRSSIPSDAVTSPACPATAVPRPRAETPTTRRTSWRLKASHAGRVKST
jgi:hypothetical protein